LIEPLGKYGLIGSQIQESIVLSKLRLGEKEIIHGIGDHRGARRDGGVDNGMRWISGTRIETHGHARRYPYFAQHRAEKT
jgi:hypothetical protein